MNAEVPDTPKPVIEYGTYALDQVPGWNETAEGLIERFAPPESLLQLFETPQIAVAYYGQSLARRHTLYQCSGVCAICVVPESDLAVGVGWSLTVTPPPVGALELRWAPPDASATFVTFHTVCRNCYSGWRTRVRTRIMFIMGGAIIAAAIVLLIALRQLFQIPWDPVPVGWVLQAAALRWQDWGWSRRWGWC